MKRSFSQISDNNTNQSLLTQIIETSETERFAALFPLLNIPQEVILETIIPQLGPKELLSFRGASKYTKQIVDNYAQSQQQWQAIYATGTDSFFINFKGEVYACGANKEGVLGLGHNKEVNTLVQVTFFNDKKIKQIKIGLNHTFFISEDGTVYGCGSNAFGQLGLAGIEKIYTPVQLDFFKDIPIKEVIAHAFKSIFISNDEQLYVCGHNKWGQLGVGHCNDVKTPIKLDFFKERLLKQVMIDDYFSSTFLTQDGQEYTCGENYGHTPVRTRLCEEKPLKEIIAGISHIFSISEDGAMYACGVNQFGQLGLGHTNHVNKPVQLNFFKNIDIKQIILFGNHSFFLTQDGQVYACGRNENGQLGLGHNNNMSTPEQISFFKDKALHQIIVCCNNTFFLTQDAQVYVCGGFSKKNIPTQIVFPKNVTIAQIQSGLDYAIFLTHDNQTFVYGKNYYGQLGLGHNNAVSTPTHISLFKDKSLQKLSALVAEERISTNKAKENRSTELIKHEENILMDVTEEEEKPFRCWRFW